MTTVVYACGILGADKAGTSLGLRRTVTKIFRIRPTVNFKNGPPSGDILYGFVGSSAFAIATKDWIETGDNKPDCRDFDVDPGSQLAMVIGIDNSIWEMSARHILLRTEDKHHSIGAGQEIAMGALDMGATCPQALKIVADRSEFAAMGFDYLSFGW